MKILYAVSRNENAKIQLARFAQAIDSSKHQLKIAAYRSSSPNINIDWTLDCLSDMFKPDILYTDSENFHIYFEQVKSFDPDLIISDLEYFTSRIANVLNIPIWQCSSALINTAMTHEQKYNLGLYKYYCEILFSNKLISNKMNNMIDNADRNLIYSHLCDTEESPSINSKFEWIRPYYMIGSPSVLCQHNLVLAMTKNDKRMFSFLRKYPDSVAFTTFPYESYDNFLLKEIFDHKEYTCNVYNSNLFVCDGSTNFLADAFYNKKFSIVIPNINDTECLVNSFYSERLGVSKTIYDFDEDVYEYSFVDISVLMNNNVNFLHEEVDKL